MQVNKYGFIYRAYSFGGKQPNNLILSIARWSKNFAERPHCHLVNNYSCELKLAYCKNYRTKYSQILHSDKDQ